MSRLQAWWRVADRWLPLVGLGLLGGLSLLVLEADYRRGVTTLEATVVALDNLTHARIAVAEAALAWEAVTVGDPTRDPAEEIARLDEATGALEDLMAGRSALLAFRKGAPIEEPGLRRLIDTYLARVSKARAAAVEGGPGRNPVAQRLRLRTLRESADELERQVHGVVEARLAAMRLGHGILLVLWGGVLVAVLGGFSALRTARTRARHNRIQAERQRAGADRQRAGAEQRYAALERLAAVGILRVERGGLVRDATSWWARLLGIEEGESRGEPWWTLFVEQDRERGADYWRERATLGVAFSQDVRVTDSEGRTRWLTGRWEPAPSPGDAAGQWVGSFVDVTEQRAVEAQLHQAQKLEAVGRLTGGLAHDFNNLLSVILTNTHLLLMDPSALGEEEREMLEDVDQAGKSGREMVKRLMGFSRRSELALEEVDLSTVVERAAGLARKLLSGRSELALDLPDPGPDVYADARAVEQILLNLVANARDAMPDGGTVHISVDEVEADAEFRGERPWVAPGYYGRMTVSDEGVGMDEATLEQVFEPFFTTKAEGKGTGLGLSTVHGLMSQHGGHVRVYSQVGRGTTFRLYFPAPSGEALRSGREASEEASTPTQPQPGSGGMTVLLVEDDAILRRTLARMLVRLGYRVVEAGNGEEALELLKGEARSAALVLSDLAMPRMDGLELHRRLRAQSDSRPFIFTSGLTASDAEERGALPEGALFLSKPWSADQLLDLIGTLDLRAG